MTIHVKTEPPGDLPGLEFTLTVESTDTIQSVKVKIQTHIDIKPDQQEVTFGGVILDGGQTLVHYSIVSGSTLHVMWSGGPGITSEDTPTPAVNPGPMTIYVKTGTGHTLTLTVQPTDTIQSVKIKIQIQIHITPNQQILTFGNVHLESGQTLVHYLIVSGSTLHVTWRIPTEHQPKENCGACDMRIFVRPMTGQTLTLHVAATDTIQITKIRIQIQISIEPAQQRLTFGGTQLHGGRTLSSYSIVSGSTLDLAWGSATPPQAVHPSAPASAPTYHHIPPPADQAGVAPVLPGYYPNE